MAAALTPATTIIAVDRVAERLHLARELGATHTVNATDGDIADAISQLTAGQGADGVVETTGSVAVARNGADSLAARGTLVLVGAPVLAENVVFTGQAACWYSWMTPPTRSRRRTRKASRSVTSAGSGLSGAALDRAM
jgi:threonine dehydrogenase-like Zn-dependent dehydrogenase